MLVVDDDPMARRALREAIESAPGLSFAGEAAGAESALEVARATAPDVALVDADMPEGDGLAATLHMHRELPPVGILMLASDPSEEMGLLALRAGATGFLARDVPLEEIVRALRSVGEGEAAISSALSRRLIDELRRLSERRSRLRPVESELTAREWQVLDLLAQGASTAGIASRLDLSVGTVRTHVKHVLRKLGAHSRAEAVAAAEALRGGTPVEPADATAVSEAAVRREFEQLRGLRGDDGQTAAWSAG